MLSSEQAGLKNSYPFLQLRIEWGEGHTWSLLGGLRLHSSNG